MRDLPLFPQTDASPASDRLIKLRDAEPRIFELFHPGSRPSRNTIIAWIEEGRLMGTQLGDGKNYYVVESSLERFLDGLRGEISSMMQLAA